jgi:hypothetical protein
MANILLDNLEMIKLMEKVNSIQIKIMDKLLMGYGKMVYWLRKFLSKNVWILIIVILIVIFKR